MKKGYSKEMRMDKRFLDIGFSGVLIVWMLITFYIFIIANCVRKIKTKDKKG